MEQKMISLFITDNFKEQQRSQLQTKEEWTKQYNNLVSAKQYKKKLN